MDRRTVLAAALAVGIAAGPATTAAPTLGALVSPAAAEHGHGTHGRGASPGDVATTPPDDHPAREHHGHADVDDPADHPRPARAG